MTSAQDPGPRLERGQRVGRYEVSSLLGVGGMGEVYRALDLEVNREVALKVLPAHLHLDAERQARFEREARLLGALRHPGIARLYEVGEHHGLRFLAMELVEGESFADTLRSRGLEDKELVLDLFAQLAAALETAHKSGIIHRDVKPSNLRLTKEDNRLKLLDFGLAKASGSLTSDAVLSDSPTRTQRDAETATGMLVGTAPYMSPEQARGQEVDHRSDIWAFGCVLFEALSGRRPFEGPSPSDILVRILGHEPDWSLLPADTEPSLLRLLHSCLRKEKKLRLQHMGDARVILEDLASGESSPALEALDQAFLSSQSALSPASTSGQRKRRLAVLAATAVLAGLLGAGTSLATRPDAGDSDRRVIRFTLQEDSATVGYPVAISPGGQRIAYDGKGGIHVRDLAGATLLVADGSHPVFTPDGGSLSYSTYDPGSIWKHSLSGGTPVDVAAHGNAKGHTWAGDGTLVFAPFTEGGLSLLRPGGEVSALTVPGPSEHSHRWPRFLPGDDAVLFTVLDLETQVWRVEVVEVANGKRRVLVDNALAPHFVEVPDDVEVPGLSEGLLLFAQGETILAAPFDLDALEVIGESVPVLTGVPNQGGYSAFDVAKNGTLVYRTENVPSSDRAGRTMAWIDRTGAVTPIPTRWKDFSTVALSPDGRKILMQTGNEVHSTWLHDLDSGTTTWATPGYGGSTPAWAPDSEHFVFSTGAHPTPNRRTGARALFLAPIDRSREPEQLTITDYEHFPSSFSPDGRFLAFSEIRTRDALDVWMLPMDEADRRSRPFLTGRAAEASAMFSPDGRWVAYLSTESGEPAIFVTRFDPEQVVATDPDGSAPPRERHRISAGQGMAPQWSPDGEYLYYREGRNPRILRVKVQTEPAFEAGLPEVAVENERLLGPIFELPKWTPHPDGERFLVRLGGGDDWGTRLHVVTNWFRELEQTLAESHQR